MAGVPMTSFARSKLTPLQTEALDAFYQRERHLIAKNRRTGWRRRNPSTLEQRTGRIDRIGARCEQVTKTIEVYLPYIGGTQDEKMYRVVTDRERWFQIIMGEDYRTDEWATEAAAERVPLAEVIARALALRLEVAENDGPRSNPVLDPVHV